MTQHISGIILGIFESFSPSNPAVVRFTKKNTTNTVKGPPLGLKDLDTGDEASIRMNSNEEANTKVFMKPKHEIQGFSQDMEIVITGYTL